jgi:hypothetical protein
VATLAMWMAAYMYISTLRHLYVIMSSKMTILAFKLVVQSQYQSLTQELVYNSPGLDLKFDAQFVRLASVSNGLPQVLQLL